ncbi:MAG: YhcH/YjgK/YiaL family protein [Elusimicrobiota bacterium]
MIIDRLSDLGNYVMIVPRLEKVIEFFNEIPPAALSDGRTEIMGNDVYVMVSSGEGKGRDGNKLEFHREYIDIHVTLSGKEILGWKSIEDCKEVDKEYDEPKDVGIFNDKPVSYVDIPEGTFVIMYPFDAHAPLCGDGKNKKVVIKIKISNLPEDELEDDSCSCGCGDEDGHKECNCKDEEKK